MSKPRSRYRQLTATLGGVAFALTVALLAFVLIAPDAPVAHQVWHAIEPPTPARHAAKPRARVASFIRAPSTPFRRIRPTKPASPSSKPEPRTSPTSKRKPPIAPDDTRIATPQVAPLAVAHAIRKPKPAPKPKRAPELRPMSPRQCDRHPRRYVAESTS